MLTDVCFASEKVSWEWVAVPGFWPSEWAPFPVLLFHVVSYLGISQPLLVSWYVLVLVNYSMRTPYCRFLSTEIFVPLCFFKCLQFFVFVSIWLDPCWFFHACPVCWNKTDLMCCQIVFRKHPWDLMLLWLKLCSVAHRINFVSAVFYVL